LGLAPVRDLREAVGWLGRRNWTELETDVLAGFVLARAAAGLSDATVSSDVRHLEQVRAWFGCPLWEMQPTRPENRTPVQRGVITRRSGVPDHGLGEVHEYAYPGTARRR